MKQVYWVYGEGLNEMLPNLEYIKNHTICPLLMGKEFFNELYCYSHQQDTQRAYTHVRIGASKVTIKTCQKTNLVGTRTSFRTGWLTQKNYICFSKVIIAPIAVIGQEILREFVEGMGENVGAATALEYVMEGSFVERYRKKMSGSSQKNKLLIVVVF